MASPPRTIPETEEHAGPEAFGAPVGRSVLLQASPAQRVLPLPILGEPVGRNWLASHGVVEPRASNPHVVVSRRGSVTFLEDAKSRNGTWINGVRLTPGDCVELTDGAVVRVGRTLLVRREAYLGDNTPAPPLGGALVGPFGLHEIAAAVSAMVRRPPRNVLVEGETGTGKELVAAFVATALGRGRAYAAVNVAGVPAGVFESQLFGYVPGAYSGSGRGSPGLFAAHNGGALFLDEIGELPLELQSKLLRTLEAGEVLPVGAVRPTTVDVVVIAATNRALDAMVEGCLFRRDLLARLAQARIEVPPLRERAEDVFAIAEALLARRGDRLDPALVEVEAVERLLLHPWRSNVRELAAALERVAGMEPPPRLRHWAIERVLGPLPAAAQAPLTRQVIEQALAASNGNESEAARRLGVSRGKLRRAGGARGRS